MTTRTAKNLIHLLFSLPLYYCFFPPSSRLCFAVLLPSLRFRRRCYHAACASSTHHHLIVHAVSSDSGKLSTSATQIRKHVLRLRNVVAVQSYQRKTLLGLSAFHSNIIPTLGNQFKRLQKRRHGPPQQHQSHFSRTSPGRLRYKLPQRRNMRLCRPVQKSTLVDFKASVLHPQLAYYSEQKPEYSIAVII